MVEFGTAMMMLLTLLPPVAKRWVAANIGGSAVTLTNICTRSHLSASAGPVAGFAFVRVSRELAEAPEPSETNEISIRAAAADDEAAWRHTAN